MKVLDLHCAERHSFEGWFASEADFQSQLERNLVACPLCADTHITKLPSAPRLNLSGARAAPESAGESLAPGLALQPTLSTHGQSQGSNQGISSQEAAQALVPASSQGPNESQVPGLPSRQRQAAWLRELRQLAASAEDVGPQFAEAARQMHYGEAPQRSIRGQATLAESAALLEEGIAVLPLDLPLALRQRLQ